MTYGGISDLKKNRNGTDTSWNPIYSQIILSMQKYYGNLKK